jgi:tetratricopeptide (TPR) repeat protein
MAQPPEVTPDNPVVKLCAAGMAAEGEGRGADAKALFEQAWESSRDDYEACIAAHYVARHQATPEATFEWNERALRRAETVGDDRVRGFFPSLYLNYAHSLEQLGRTAEACRHYGLAAAWLDDLPPGGYADLVRGGVTAGQRRTCGDRHGWRECSNCRSELLT